MLSDENESCGPAYNPSRSLAEWERLIAQTKRELLLLSLVTYWRCRLRKTVPDPDLRYRSNWIAFSFDWNAA